MKTIKDAEWEFYNSTVIDRALDGYKTQFQSGVDFAQRWIPVEEELPPSQKRVMVKVKFGTSGEPWTIIACYIPFMTVLEAEFMDEDYLEQGDYDKENDVYYTPAGWYESNLYSDTNYHVSDKVVSWRPIERK